MSTKAPNRTFVLKATVAANAPAGTVIPMNILFDPLDAGSVDKQVPVDQNWAITDIYVTGTQTPDGVVQVVRNSGNIPLVTPPVNTLLVSNPSRPRIMPAVALPAATQFRFFYITNANNGASATTVTVYAQVDVF